MARWKIVWTESAARQRRLILEYWFQRNQSNVYPRKLLRLSDEKAERISDNPLIFRKAEFPDTRVATIGHYSLFYKIIQDQIVITAFWDNRQDPKELLEHLKSPNDRR